MKEIMIILDICSNIGLVKVFRFLLILLRIVFIVVPIGLIVMLSIDFSKNVINDVDYAKKNSKVIIQRIIMAMLLFALPYIVRLFMNTLGNIDKKWVGCFNILLKTSTGEIDDLSVENVEMIIAKLDARGENIDKNDIRQLENAIRNIKTLSLREPYKEKLDGYKTIVYCKEADLIVAEIEKKDDSKITPRDLERLEIAIHEIPDNVKRKEYKARLDEFRSRYERYKKNNSSSGGDSGGNGGDSGDDSKISKTIIIGDSRTNGLKAAVNASSDYTFIAEDSKGYDWFKETAIKELDNILSNSSDKYNIVINLGVNDIHNVSNYVAEYNNLASKYSNHNIVIVSVNPVDDSRSPNVKNSEIVDFNNKIESGISENIDYCDVYDEIIDNYSTVDGIHYTDQTYKDIFGYINECI